MSRAYSPQYLEESLYEKSLSGLKSVGFGSATLQEQTLCAPFQLFVRSSAGVFEGFHTVSEVEFCELRLLGGLRSWADRAVSRHPL